MTSPVKNVLTQLPPAVVGQVMSSDFVPDHARTAELVRVPTGKPQKVSNAHEPTVPPSKDASSAGSRFPATPGVR
jgi:hypothetical protein